MNIAETPPKILAADLLSREIPDALWDELRAEGLLTEDGQRP